MQTVTKIVDKAYIVVILALVLLGFYYLAFYRLNVNGSETKRGYSLVRYEDRSDEMQGGDRKLTIHLDNVAEENCHLIFFTIHQSVAVYYGAERLYSLKISNSNAFTKTPGCVWNDVLLREDMNGSDVTIYLTPAYRGFSYDLPDVYLGDRGSILAAMVRKEIFPVVISLILIVMGTAMATYVIYNRKNAEVDGNLMWLGFLALCGGLWKIGDAAIVKLVFRTLPIFSLLPFMALAMMVIPFMTYISELHNSKDSKIWLIPSAFSIAVIYFSILVQYFNLMDMRQLLSVYIIAISLALAVTAYMVFREYQNYGWSVKLRRNLIGMAVIIVGFLVDIGTYAVSGGKHTTGFIIFGFMLYIVAQGVFIFKESGALIDAGEGVQQMEDLAFHDKLTGLFNRAAFITDTDPYAVVPDHYAVAVLDLNDLKKCNDTLGHDVGDRYIRDSAKIIQSTFGSIGNCYRMGGDEFYCLVPKGGRTACREQEAVMEKLIAEYNEKSPDLKISIACGYARYDNRLDYDLNATAKRADKLMYQRKEEMKGQKPRS